MKTTLYFFTVFLISAQRVLSWTICNDQIYGKIDKQDCSNAYRKMPGGDGAKDPELNVFRLFSEPQYLRPPFSSMVNPWGRDGVAIVQLPKLWRSS